ncbi:hypothetical protein O181_090831 [Austropuccinia psidii MF-1]|uniref:Uncharacterized protein n=1 Tax=Austropuccinia psidii MF-1 TaxID=1389203 RepID=A0A9Q3IWB8_9BASI|nr:hypothetical protein [Austropuccinia psidii MF-1]
MEDSRASKNSQRLPIIFYTLLESQESDITAICVFRYEKLPTGSSRNIPVSAQELVYGSKAARVGTSAQIVDRDYEPRKDTRTSGGVETHVLQGTGPKEKILVEKPKHLFRGSEERVG